MGDGWMPIETAPKDGTPILVYVPGGIDHDENVWTWADAPALYVTPARWHEPNQHTDAGPGWFAPSFHVIGGVWDDPGDTRYCSEVKPTHWMPLPSPPEDR